MWDATPGHATPGHATPGRETPSHDKGASSRRNRWDETPKTERGILSTFAIKKQKFWWGKTVNVIVYGEIFVENYFHRFGSCSSSCQSFCGLVNGYMRFS